MSPRGGGEGEAKAKEKGEGNKKRAGVTGVVRSPIHPSIDRSPPAAHRQEGEGQKTQVKSKGYSNTVR